MSRKYKNARKYSYNSGVNIKKYILIVLAVVLIVAAALLAFTILGNDSGIGGNSGVATISIHSLPDKTFYYLGDAPSWFGLKVKLTTADGSTVIVGPEACTITGFDSSSPVENQVITVQYKEHSVTFTVTISDFAGNQQPSGQFYGMSFKSMPKTEYKVGENLSVEGGVLLLQYDDGATLEMDMSDSMISGFNSKKAGTYTVTVKYMENGYLAELSYEITVTE